MCAPTAALLHRMLSLVTAAALCVHPLHYLCTGCCPCSILQPCACTHCSAGALSVLLAPCCSPMCTLCIADVLKAVLGPCCSPRNPPVAALLHQNAALRPCCIPMHPCIPLQPWCMDCCAQPCHAQSVALHHVPTLGAGVSTCTHLTPALLRSVLLLLHPAPLLLQPMLPHACIQSGHDAPSATAQPSPTPAAMPLAQTMRAHPPTPACTHLCTPCTPMHCIFTCVCAWCSSAAGRSLEVSLQPAAPAWRVFGEEGELRPGPHPQRSFGEQSTEPRCPLELLFWQWETEAALGRVSYVSPSLSPPPALSFRAELTKVASALELIYSADIKAAEGLAGGRWGFTSWVLRGAGTPPGVPAVKCSHSQCCRPGGGGCELCPHPRRSSFPSRLPLCSWDHPGPHVSL